MAQLKSRLRQLGRPLFIFLTLIAIGGLVVQALFPEAYFSSQEQLRAWVQSAKPFDAPIFIAAQALQVVITPISHYTVSILGGVLYGQWLGGIYNWIGRIIGHTIAFWIAKSIGVRAVQSFFAPEDLRRYQKFVQGEKRTLHLRLSALFLMLFLPLFPDDEISYLVGLGGLPFRYYFPVLLLGHLGGSFALAYLGAGVETRDPYFWFLTILTIFLAVLLILAIRRLASSEDQNSETSIAQSPVTESSES